MIFTFHNLYVFVYFFLSLGSLIVQAVFDIQFKKRKKLLCLSVLSVLLMIPSAIVILTNHFATGKEALPLWFYIGVFACFVPLALWAEGNPFLNWLNFVLVGDFSLAMLEFPIGVASAVFIKDPHPIVWEFEASSLKLIFPFFVVISFITFFSLYLRKLWQRIIPRKWLANTMFIISLFPMCILSYVNPTVSNGVFRANFSLQSGILGIISLPVTILILLMIHYLVEQKKDKKRLRQFKEENAEIFENHKNITSLTERTAIWRHDIHNHLEVIEYTISKDSAQTINVPEQTGNIREILSRTDEILSASKNMNLQEYTGNHVLDSLFSIKALTAKEQNTGIEYDFSLPEECMIDDYDLVTVCSNLLDNALEACMKLAEENRTIRFYIYEKKGYLCFDIINSFIAGSDEVSFFQTTKRNPKEHGYGIKIIRDITRKYHGYLNITNDKNDEIRVFVALKQ